MNETPAAIIRSIGDLAALIGVSVTAVKQWIDQGLPRRPDKTFSGPDAIRWFCDRRIAQLEKRAAGAPTKGGERSEFAEWRTREVKATALTKEQKLEVLTGRYYEAGDVQRLLAERLQYLSSGVLELKTLARELHGKAEAAIAERLEARGRQLIEAYGKNNLVEVLDEWRRLKNGNPTLKRGRGRPKKPAAE